MNKKELIEFQKDMGVEDLIDDSPGLKNKKAQQKQVMKKKKTPEEKKINDKFLNIAIEQANKATTLQELKKSIEEFDGLDIKKTANNVVFSDGVAESDIMIIGEAPGAEEDLQGRPFCGASGQLLDVMLSHIGVSRQKNCYITNAVFWRPPGNRKPDSKELELCEPFFQKHVALVRPKLLILVGSTPLSALLKVKEGISKVRGQFFDYTNQYIEQPIKTVVLFHPSYLLRSPNQKKFAWIDLQNIRKFIIENNLKY